MKKDNRQFRFLGFTPDGRQTTGLLINPLIPIRTNDIDPGDGSGLPPNVLDIPPAPIKQINEPEILSPIVMPGLVLSPTPPPKITNPNTTYTDPALEVNFASLNCTSITDLLGYVNGILSTRDRMPEDVLNYYTVKQSELQALYQTCSAPTPPNQNPTGVISGLPMPLNIYSISPAGSITPIAGPAAGGGGGSDTKSKKSFCWLCLLGAVLAGIAIYNMRK